MPELRSSDHQFSAPPVYETALAIQFEELTGFRTVHFGRYFERVADRFPVVEDHPRAEPIFESFPTVPRQLTLQLIPKKHGPERVWYRDEPDGSVLLQLQPDRFSLNWRRSTGSDKYPSFAENGRLFLNEIEGFRDFCSSSELGEIRPSLSEVIYVNRLFPNADETAVECMSRAFVGLSWESSDEGLPTPELVTFNRVYPIGVEDGRLYAEAGIARHPEQGDFVQLKMTARVLIRDDGAIPDALQSAHDSIVNGFVSITTDSARTERWEQQ